MRARHFVTTVAMMLVTAVGASAQLRPTDLRFEAKTLPSGSVGHRYVATMRVVNGTAPLTWRIASGKVPPGVELMLRNGTLNGVPTSAGTFRFRVTVNDSTGQSASADFVITVQDHLVISWKDAPRLEENTIKGAVTVENASKDTFDLTVIIMAVNEYGKAFALGYQRFNLAQQIDQNIKFESTVPNGRYIVHADAVAEVPAKKQIYRARLQTSEALAVNVNR